VEEALTMKISIKITTLIVAILAIFTLTNIIQSKTLASSSLKGNNRQIANVAVIFFKMDDPYTMRVVESLKNLEKEKQNNVKFTFFDPSNNIAILNEMLDSSLQRGYDLFILYLPDKKESMVEDVINRVKPKNIPLILMNIPPEVVAKTSKLYNKVAFVTPDSKAAGIAQGKLLLIYGIVIRAL
jgi:methyl-galactoside transport system substrate-binding protein